MCSFDHVPVSLSRFGVRAFGLSYVCRLLSFGTRHSTTQRPDMDGRETWQQESRVDRRLIRVEEAAQALSLGRSKTWELISSGELPTVRIGRAVRVPVRALDEWLQDQDNKKAGALKPAPTDSKAGKR